MDRRSFLAGSGSLGSLLIGGGLPHSWAVDQVLADTAPVTPDLVRLRPEIAPLVALIERTPREQCVAMLAQHLRAGVPFRELIAASFLHALGYQAHHEVYLVHAAYQLSLDARPEDRLLPLFWAVDVIKEHIGRFQYQAVPALRGRLPSADQAGTELDEAMRTWDSERAELAVVALSEHAGPQATMERLWHYAARDWSFIGHLPIAVANTARTLDTIGWQHAAPVLRYLVRELHVRNTGRLRDQPYAVNLERVQRAMPDLPAGWAASTADANATTELLTLIRRGAWEPACAWAMTRLQRGQIRAGTIWDAVHLAAGEFMIRFRLGGARITNRALHSNTCMNALHYAFRASRNPADRVLILLQAVAWVTAFTANEAGRGMLRDLSITEIPPAQAPKTAPEAVEAIFATLPPREFRREITDRSGQDTACRMTFAHARDNPSAALFLQSARQLLCRKATINAHDYKFPIAMFEDIHWVSDRWRPHLLAASVHFLHGTRSEDNAVMQQARAALD